MGGGEQSVSVHVRRGDYQTPGHYERLGCICTEAYYRNAAELMKKKVGNPKFYVFSDEPEWVKAHLRLGDTTFVDWNRGNDSWQDMLLMRHCRHNIVCNSSFSWWGAWLNDNQGKIVVAPDRWFGKNDHPDIVPEGWLRVSTQ